VSNTASSTDAALDLDITYNAETSAPAEAPSAVQSATATPTSDTTAQISWTKPACDGSSYVTSYAIAIAGGGGGTVAVTNPFTASYTTTLSGLTACSGYQVSVTAVNAAGASTPTVTTLQTPCPSFSLLTAATADDVAGTSSKMYWK
jgi:hypothetical protein